MLEYRKPPPQQLTARSCNPIHSGDRPCPKHIPLNSPAFKREKSCFSWIWYLKIISVWESVLWLPEKNIQRLSNLLLMPITAHQRLDTHKRNQSDYKSKPKHVLTIKKPNKYDSYDCNMIKYAECFLSNLQAAAYKNHIHYHKSPGKWTLTNISHM